MLQIAVDDAHAADVVAELGDAWHQRTVAADHDVYLHASLRCLIEFAYHIGIGDVVDLHLHPSLLALVGILNLGVEHAQDAALHGVRRHEELVEAEWREWAVDEIEYLSHLVYQLRTGCHHQIVGIDLGIAFVEVSGSHAGDVALL